MAGKWSRRRQPGQEGSALLEFVLVIPIFVLVLYGLVAYGMALSLKSSLTNAAADGARAAVGAQIAPADNGSQNAAYIRVAQAKVASALSNYSSATAALLANSQYLVGYCTAGDNTSGTCMTVALSWDYKTYGLVPLAPGLNVVIPSTITSTYKVRVS